MLVFLFVIFCFIINAGLTRQSYALLKEEGVEIDIDFYITSVKALLKLIQVNPDCFHCVKSLVFVSVAC